MMYMLQIMLSSNCSWS